MKMKQKIQFSILILVLVLISGCITDNTDNNESNINYKKEPEKNVFLLNNFTFYVHYNNSELNFEKCKLNDDISGLGQWFSIIITPSKKTDYHVKLPLITYNNNSVARITKDLIIIDGNGEYDFIVENGTPLIDIRSNKKIELAVHKGNSDRDTDDSFLYDLSITNFPDNDKNNWTSSYTKYYTQIDASDVSLNISYFYSSDDGFYKTYWIEFTSVISRNGWIATRITKDYMGQ
jgi:hypothetical protein